MTIAKYEETFSRDSLLAKHLQIFQAYMYLIFCQEFDPDVKAMSPDAEQFVAQALPTLGWVQRTCGHWTHGLQVRRCFFTFVFFVTLGT